MRYFEKIPKNQFISDINNDLSKYSNYTLPRRTSPNAAGYDFFLIEDIELNPGETLKIPTGIRAKMAPDEVLLIIMRHSLGFKGIQLINQVGVIDADYYNADNYGHIFIKIKNESDKIFKLSANEAIAQGIFTKFLLADDDAPINRHRINA